MTIPRFELIQTIRKASRALEASPKYQWGHMGSCNCGFLAQAVTTLSGNEIHQRAMLGCGDWSEQLNDYCPVNGLPFDEIIRALITFGFDADDLRNLEKLSDPTVLRALPSKERDLRHNVKADVVLYMNTWAGLLETQLIKDIPIEFVNEPVNLPCGI